MKLCPSCDDTALTPGMTEPGVEISICPRCQGIWLDRDVIYYFSSMPTYIKSQLTDAIAKKWLTVRKSPVSGESMFELSMFDGDAHLNFCKHSGGLWIEQAELTRIPEEKCRILVDEGSYQKIVAEEQSPQYQTPFADPEVPKLPPKIISLVSMFAVMFFFFLIAVSVISSVTGIDFVSLLLIGFLMLFFQLALAPFIMDIYIKRNYDFEWIKPIGLKSDLEDYISEICRRENIRFPKIGLISDEAPIIFSYGYNANSARLIFSKGLFDALDDQELQTVVAHEFGHITQLDLFLMTFAQIIPVICYKIYSISAKTKYDIKNNYKGDARNIFAVLTYFIFAFSQSIVLWFSRIREYHADQYAVQSTQKPEKLAEAVVKIGLGIAGKRSKQSAVSQLKRSKDIAALDPLNIINTKQAFILALSGLTSNQGIGEVDNQNAVMNVSIWEKWSPWAFYFEWGLAHPLLSSRLKYLNKACYDYGREPYAKLVDHEPEALWDNFPVECIINILPKIILLFGTLALFSNIVSIIAQRAFISAFENFSFVPISVFCVLFGVSYFVKTIYAYPQSQFLPMNINALSKNIKVSNLRGIPCRISGQISGRGLPGVLSSENVLFLDTTGKIFLDYEQPSLTMNYLFSPLPKVNYQMQAAELTGWFRRSPVPYIEVRDLKVENKVLSSKVYLYKLSLAVILTLIGILTFIFL